jgi:hypothetical protein
MITKGGVKVTPSYKHEVVDRGKGRRGIVFKAPVTRTSGSNTGKGQERNQGRSECMGEEARESHREVQDTMMPNGAVVCNPCKPQKIMIPKVILEDPQTQIYSDQMKTHELICKFMGL